MRSIQIRLAQSGISSNIMLMTESSLKKVYIYVIQIIFVSSIAFGSQSISFDNTEKWMSSVARYIFYILIIKGTQLTSVLVYDTIESKCKLDITKLVGDNKIYLLIFVSSVCALLYTREPFWKQDFLFLFIAYVVCKYPEMDSASSSINYGTGMACSFFEGYLTHIIPSDGAQFVGFEENINIYEAKQGVIFPVKRLFLVITKSLYCPPDLKQFNKKNRDDLPTLEACQSLEDVEKDVAGVKGRTYRNSAYKIHRPGAPLVYLAAECATPLHTLHRVLKNRYIYDKLVDVNVSEIVKDFCGMLKYIIERSPECRDKCELVFYDDTDPQQNLADILLDKIRELEPNFENIIRKKSM